MGKSRGKSSRKSLPLTYKSLHKAAHNVGRKSIAEVGKSKKNKRLDPTLAHVMNFSCMQPKCNRINAEPQQHHRKIQRQPKCSRIAKEQQQHIETVQRTLQQVEEEVKELKEELQKRDLQYLELQWENLELREKVERMEERDLENFGWSIKHMTSTLWVAI